MPRREICDCEIYKTCPQCRGTDRDMGLFLEREKQREAQKKREAKKMLRLAAGIE